MNASPLSKDQRLARGTPVADKVVKTKQPISSGTARKLLKTSGAVIGTTETYWLNRYMENKVSGECLPKSFLSNDLFAELSRIYGKNSKQFIDQIVTDFKRENGISEITVEANESTSGHDES